MMNKQLYFFFGGGAALAASAAAAAAAAAAASSAPGNFQSFKLFTSLSSSASMRIRLFSASVTHTGFSFSSSQRITVLFAPKLCCCSVSLFLMRVPCGSCGVGSVRR